MLLSLILAGFYYLWFMMRVKTLRASPAAGVMRLPFFTEIPRLSDRP